MAPPFHLRPLVRPVFAPSASTSIDPPHQTPVSGPSKNPIVRSVDGYGSFLWIGSNDGRVKGFDLKLSPSPNPGRRTRSTSLEHLTPRSTSLNSPTPSLGSPSSKPIAPSSVDASDLIDGGHEACCFQDNYIFPSTETVRSKPVDRLLLIPTISLAVILSEGAVTFHSILNLQPQPLAGFPIIRGVSAVTLDEDTFDFPQQSGPASHPEVTMCVIKKKTIHLFCLRESGVQQVHELQFASAAFNGILRRSVLLLSDVEQYYLVSLSDTADLIPLLPVSQSSSMTHESGRQSPSSLQPSPQHRPSMSAIPNSDEFLIASHTGQTCLGVFVSSSGDPSRGTLQWLSNPRSVCVNTAHVIALLFNGTIEIHSLVTQELLQLITLSPGLDARTLTSAKFGVSVPGESFESRLEIVKIPLLRSQSVDPPSTPPMQGSLFQSTQSHRPVASTSYLFLVGRDSVHALCTRSVLAEVECLMANNRWDEALQFTESAVSLDTHQHHLSNSLRSRQSQTRSGLIEGSKQMPHIQYIYQKIALHCLSETKFQGAGDLWFKGKGDPRVLIKLYPHLRANAVARDDEIEIYSALDMPIREFRSADALIMANLVRNYSPHIKPNVETAPSTVDLKAQLSEKVMLMLLSYLRRWKRDRLLHGGASLPNRHLDVVVDTALAELLAERRAVDPEAGNELTHLLERPNLCAQEELEIVFQRNKCYALLGELYLKSNNVPKVLETWSKLHDKEWEDLAFNDPLERMVNLIQKVDQPTLVATYAVWLASHDWNISIRVLMESAVSDSINVQETLVRLQNVNADAARVYLEHLVLRSPRRRKRQAVRDPPAAELTVLRTSLILGYLSRLKQAMSPRSHEGQSQPSMVGMLFRDLIHTYIDRDSNESVRPTFVDFLLSAHAEGCQLPESDPASLRHRGCFDPILTRLKLIVCLQQSVPASGEAYDVLSVRHALDEMGGSPEMMAYERAIVYSKLGLHRPALSLLAVTLRDLSSSELYCLRAGAFLTTAQVRTILQRAGMSSSSSTTSSGSENSRAVSAELLMILLDLAIGTEGITSGDSLGSLLARHTPQLTLSQTLPILPPGWPVRTVAQHSTRSLRHNAHLRHEAKLLKAVAAGQEFAMMEIAAGHSWVEEAGSGDSARDEGGDTAIELVPISQDWEGKKMKM